jgi:ectoine hydroxylase-related dioxygenase (phytanoyl-CoA dioxygenase family)
MISSEQIDLWLREFRLNGFVVLENFLPVEEVLAFHEQLRPILQGEFAAASLGTAKSLRGAARIAFDLTRYQQVLASPFYTDLYTNNRVIEQLVATILEPAGGWRRGWTQVECPFPGSAYMTWHSDQTLEETPHPDLPNRTVRVTYNIPLVDFTWASGAMEVLPGSHLLPRNDLIFAFETLPRLYPVALRLRPGDALLRDGNMLHRGTPNMSAAPRPMLDQTYKARASTG